MQDTATGESAVRQRILDILERVLGYQPDPNIEELAEMDSLQVLELLVSLEEEFDIDTDRIVETMPEWWRSMSELVSSISSLLQEPVAAPALDGD